ncbi:uncharacterized protein C8R40DRAFT_1174443 [Lentinula edodes]|uniref:uncharacterized protein n=1 Tax=Lentinula edodes TaxID=5353 RepID=UPI001E8D8634|nr:uncharacterized protein C8R40DRAFT_1174443 [Lentinula edodes]KAH7871653.1 hypothetical protein C8R40DRAFT_1174443 [Lentinula edodes]
MEPDEATDDGTHDSTPRRLSWYRRETHDYYRYGVDDDGIIQKIVDNPNSNAEEVNTRGRAKTPPPQKGALKQRDEKHASSATAGEVRGATPVTFKFSAPAPKYFLKGSKRASGDSYGPTKLQTTPFRSHTSDNELASFLCERERKESNGHSNQPI